MSNLRHPHLASLFSPRFSRTRRHLLGVSTRTSRHLFGDEQIPGFAHRRGLRRLIAELVNRDRQRQRVLNSKNSETKGRDGARCLSEIFRSGQEDGDETFGRGLRRRKREQTELFRRVIREMIRAGIVRGITPRIVGDDHVFGFAKRRLFAARRAPRRWTIVRDHPASDTPREGTASPGWSQPLPSRDASAAPHPPAGGGPPNRPTSRLTP